MGQISVKHWTPLVIVKDQSSHLVYLKIIMNKITNSLKFLTQLVVKVAREKKWKKNTLLTRSVCFRKLDFGTSKSNSEVSKPNSNIFVENYFFLENYVTSEGPFLTMLYTTNSSTLLVTTKVFTLTIISSN